MVVLIDFNQIGTLSGSIAIGVAQTRFTGDFSSLWWNEDTTLELAVGVGRADQKPDHRRSDRVANTTSCCVSRRVGFSATCGREPFSGSVTGRVVLVGLLIILGLSQYQLWFERARSRCNETNSKRN